MNKQVWIPIFDYLAECKVDYEMIKGYEGHYSGAPENCFPLCETEYFINSITFRGQCVIDVLIFPTVRDRIIEQLEAD